jgi:hypothetical protein
VDDEQDLSEYEALSFAVSQHRSIAQNEITEKKLLYPGCLPVAMKYSG